MRRTEVVGLLVNSLQDFCEAFNEGQLQPLLEADVVAFLYHRLLVNGCSPAEVHLDTRVCAQSVLRKRKYDLAIGPINERSACVDPLLVAQVKCFQRRGLSHQQHRRRFEAIIGEDFTTLLRLETMLPTRRFQIVTDLVNSPGLTGYLNGTYLGRKRQDILKEAFSGSGIHLFWARPRQDGQLELIELS